MQISKQIAANHAYGSSAECEPCPGVSQHDRAWGGCYKQPSADAPGTGSSDGLQHKPAAEEAARVAPPRGWLCAGQARTERHIQNTCCIWNGLVGSFRGERDFPQSLTRKQLNEKTKRWPHCFWAGQCIIYICFPFVQVWKDKLSSNRIKRDGCCILFLDMML